METQKLTLEDINEVIKYFANQIQLRIEQLDQKRGLFLSFHELSPNNSQPSVQFLAIIQKHSSLQTSDPMEHKLIRKFAERIIQIFQFFKQKTSRHSEGLLNLIESKIKTKLSEMIEKQSIEGGQVLRFAFYLTRQGALTNFLKSSHSIKREKAPKTRERYLKSCATSIKVNAIQPNFLKDEKHIEGERSLENYTVMAKLSGAKSHLNFQSFSQIQTTKQVLHKQKSGSFNRPFSSKPGKSLQRVSESEQNILVKGPRKYSLSKKRDSYLKVIFKNQGIQKEAKPLLIQKPLDIEKLYVGMDIDKKYIQKMVDKREILTRDMTKRNERIIMGIKRQKRRERTFPAEQQLGQYEGLMIGQGQRSQTLNAEIMPLEEMSNRNIIIGTAKGLGKRHSLRTMTYQNQLQKKRKMFDRDISTRKTGRIRSILVENKQNWEGF